MYAAIELCVVVCSTELSNNDLKFLIATRGPAEAEAEAEERVAESHVRAFDSLAFSKHDTPPSSTNPTR